MGKPKPVPASFHGQIRITRGGRFRLDNLKGRTTDAVKEATTERVKGAVRGATVDKAAARAEKRNAQRRLSGLESARDKMTDPKKITAANKAIEQFRKANDL